MEFKTKAPLLLLSSLLLLGCGPSASSSTSPSSSELGTSVGSSSPSSLESSSEGSSNEESESSSSSEPSADLTLEEAASLLGQANFTMDALCDYDGGSIEYFDYVISTDLVVQTDGDETYIYGSNGQYTCQAYLYDGVLEDQSILSPVPGPTSPTISPTRPSISSAPFPIGKSKGMGMFPPTRIPLSPFSPISALRSTVPIRLRRSA